MRVLLTGSSGTVGKALENISADITPYDLPDHDVLDMAQLSNAALNHDAMIHLAWNVAKEHCGSEHVSGYIDPNNTQMYLNAYEAARKAGVGRVIMASSIHADNFTKPVKLPLNADDIPVPHCPYGANKVFMERIGRTYASQGLGVICIRFGAVRADDDRSNIDIQEQHVWCGHEDAVSLVNSALSAPLHDNYEIVYGVSNNSGRIHSTENALGWHPER